MDRKRSYPRLSYSGKTYPVFTTLLHVVEWRAVTVIVSACWCGTPVTALSVTPEKAVAVAVLFKTVPSTVPSNANVRVWHKGTEMWQPANKSLQQYRAESGKTSEDDLLELMRAPANESQFQVFNLGHKINTPPNLEAYIRPTQFKQEIRVRPDSLLQLEALHKSRLIRGIARWLSRQSGETHWVQVEDTLGAATRTDLMVQVDDNGAAIFYVASGEMQLTNLAIAGDTTVLTSGEAAFAAGGTNRLEKLPRLDMRVRRMVQMFSYYPGVLSLEDLGVNLAADPDLSDSITAYSVGNLPLALALYPTHREPASNAERLYRASLVLTVGNYPAARSLLTNMATNEAHYSTHTKLADAIEQVIAVAEGIEWDFSTLAMDDVTDFQSLARKLSRGETAVDRYVAARLSPATQGALVNYQRDTSTALILQTALLEDLNSLIGGPSIYDTERFADVSLRSETRHALSHYHPDGDFRLLNRLLLGDAYPLELSRQHEEARRGAPGSPTAWLAESYYQQSRVGHPYRAHSWERKAYGRASAASELALDRALIAAKNATTNMTPTWPPFGFAWVRRAEMEFCLGRVKQATKSLGHVKDQQQGNAQAMALQGFLAWARNDYDAALGSFTHAVHLDGRLGNAWLGLGLAKLRSENVFEYFRRGYPCDFWRAKQASDGLRDLETAVAVEPDRSLLRSYLGKAYYEASGLCGPDAMLQTNAFEQIALAKRLDTNDPTPYLYSGLITMQENRVNEAVRELEQSIQRNSNRAIYRSRLLLDQDRAVQGANLAAMYRDAGLVEVSVREGSRAMLYDYGNGPAHLFLANSLDALRDPQQFNLRYETPWLSELLLANLLKPVGAGSLSQTISQHEYSRMFERNHCGMYSLTEYRNTGDWQQIGSFYLTQEQMSASIDVNYLSQSGYRANHDQENVAVWGKVKYQSSIHDSFLLQALVADVQSGDMAQYYDPEWARTTLRIHEREAPILLLGYHRDWSPGQDTLLLVSYLNNTITQVDGGRTNAVVYRNPNGAADPNFGVGTFVSDLDYDSRLDMGSIEAQHIWLKEPHWSVLPRSTSVIGARAQAGVFETEDVLASPRSYGMFPPILFSSSLSDTRVSSDFRRLSAYGYETAEFDPGVIGDAMWLTVGVCYDYLHYPVNHRASPISGLEASREQLSPKVGLTLALDSYSTFRMAYTRSLGGVSLDQSFRLEPTQVAGFLQSFRSLVPESVAGALAAPRFETWAIGYDIRGWNNLNAGVVGEWLRSDADKHSGVYDSMLGQPVLGSSVRSDLSYSERSIKVDLGYLAGDEVSLIATYRVAFAEYSEAFAGLGPDFGTVERSALLHEGVFRVICNSGTRTLNGRRLARRHGYYSILEAIWRAQTNYDYEPALPGDDVWQFNVFVGYRFPHRAAELRLGLLNITDQDYRFNPLTSHVDLPRERTFVVSLKFNL